jgi:predicted transcriptional regulator of viral defense system
MTQIDAFVRLKELGTSLFETKEVASLLNVSTKNAHIILHRLSEKGLIVPLSHGKWVLTDKADRFALLAYLTSPSPSYISLQSALYQHGLISQIPQVIYGVSLGRRCLYKTKLGTYSIHHVDSHFFFGFESGDKPDVFIATPEKAVLDYLYLSPGKTSLFGKLPEIEFPVSFNWNLAFEWVEKITSPRTRTFVKEKLSFLKSK